MAEPKADEATPMLPLAVGRKLWAIREDALSNLGTMRRNLASAWMQLASSAPPKLAARGASDTRTTGAVAVIPLTGILTPRGSFLSYLFGGAAGGLQAFCEDFEDALHDPEIGSIVIDVDSPGGLVDLVQETADLVREARGEKPIIAVANTMAASAAYWIAAQADELVVTPSGEVGSIGVYVVHEDWSGMNEAMGIVPTYISAGKHKTEGNPDEPLSDEAKAAWQEEVNDLYTMFVDSVAAGRGVTSETVINGYGEGRCLLAARALEAGMVDRVATLTDVVAERLGATADGGRLARRAERPRRPVAEIPGESGDEIVEPPEIEEPNDPGEEKNPVQELGAEEPEGDKPEDTTSDDLNPEARAAIADILAG